MLFAHHAASIISAALTTSSDTAVTAIAAQPNSAFDFGIIFNPDGSAAGQWSRDGFVNHVGTIAAGPSCTIIQGGQIPNAITVRRLTGGSNLSSARVILW